MSSTHLQSTQAELDAARTKVKDISTEKSNQEDQVTRLKDRLREAERKEDSKESKFQSVECAKSCRAEPSTNAILVKGIEKSLDYVQNTLSVTRRRLDSAKKAEQKAVNRLRTERELA